MRDCIKLLPENDIIVALIQLTHPSRTEQAGIPNSGWKTTGDYYYESIRPSEDLPPVISDYMKYHVLLYNHQAAITKLMGNIIGLAGFFQQHKIKYLIYNGPDENTQFEPEQFYAFLKNDPGVIDLYNFDMLSLTGQQTHPDEAGMQIIANFLIDKYLTNLA